MKTGVGHFEEQAGDTGHESYADDGNVVGVDRSGQ